MRNLKKIREGKAMSKEKLAGEVDCSFRSIENYEKGRMTPSVEVAARIAKALDVTIEELIR